MLIIVADLIVLFGTVIWLALITSVNKKLPNAEKLTISFINLAIGFMAGMATMDIFVKLNS